MDPRGSCLAAARGDRDIGREKARGEADAQNEKCTAPSTKRSIRPSRVRAGEAYWSSTERTDPK